MKLHYFAIYKPYGMLSQFTGDEKVSVLGDLFPFPKDVYSIGRLDKDSEGLLLLTNDNQFKNTVLSPKNKLEKTYWVQVENDITETACQNLQNGTLTIKHNGKRIKVLPAKCEKMETPQIPERSVPIRYRKNIPTSWIALTLSEGKNRQVRQMTAAVGFPTLRLIRFSIGDYELGKLQPGDVVEIQPDEIIPNWNKQ